MNFKHPKHQLAAIGWTISVIFVAVAMVQSAKADPDRRQDGDIAVIDIPHPKQGNLLMLRGLVGNGTASFRVNGACRSMPVRFVAGDFSGQSVDLGRATAIRVVTTSSDVIRDLLAGKDLVSDMVRVTSDSADKAADLYLEQGLSAETGFVINPGRSLLADMFGARNTDVECASLSAKLP